jgi:hypothetical protein
MTPIRWLMLIGLVVLGTDSHARNVVQGGADPCTETCTFVLCRTDGRLQPCPDPCGFGGIRMEVPAANSYGRGSVLVKLLRLPRAAPGSPESRVARARLDCVPTGRPCAICQTDAECDDGIPETRDVCIPLEGVCRHLCS